MKKLYKSYALNISSLLALIEICFVGKDCYELFPKIFEAGGFFVMLFYFACCLFFVCVFVATIAAEYLFKQAKYKFAFNFPYEKILFKRGYYFLFFLGLFWGSLLILLFFVFVLLFITAFFIT